MNIVKKKVISGSYLPFAPLSLVLGILVIYTNFLKQIDYGEGANSCLLNGIAVSASQNGKLAWRLTR